MVATLAAIGRCDMSRVLTRGATTVVAGGTPGGNPCVIETHNRYKGRRAVAIAAIACRCNVSGGLPCGDAAVVTDVATRCTHLTMIDGDHRDEPRCGMAALTLRAGRDVIRRFPHCQVAIVAVGTPPQNLTVINRKRNPGNRQMASLAAVGGRKVERVFPRRRETIVTALTAPRNGAMIKKRGIHQP